MYDASLYARMHGDVGSASSMDQFVHSFGVDLAGRRGTSEFFVEHLEE